jgi:hypothetical protein
MNMLDVVQGVGSVVVAYLAIRVAATVLDVGQRTYRRLRGDKTAWSADV